MVTAQALACSECLFSVYLVPECSIEVTGGVAYSIGDQCLSASISDNTCDCMPNGTDDVRINGSPPPVCVNDGDTISVSIVPSPQCELLGSEGPICETGQEFMARRLMTDRLMKLTSFRAAMRNKILSRIQVVRQGRGGGKKIY